MGVHGQMPQLGSTLRRRRLADHDLQRSSLSLPRLLLVKFMRPRHGRPVIGRGNHVVLGWNRISLRTEEANVEQQFAVLRQLVGRHWNRLPGLIIKHASLSRPDRRQQCFSILRREIGCDSIESAGRGRYHLWGSKIRMDGASMRKPCVSSARPQPVHLPRRAPRWSDSPR